MRLLNKLFNNFTYKKLLVNMVHIGHKVQKLNYFFRPYLYCIRNKYTIINLKYTILGLRLSLNFLYKLSLKRGTVCIINNHINYFNSFFLASKFSNCIFFLKKWISGLFTNFKKMNFISRLNIKKFYNNYFISFIRKLPTCLVILNLNSTSNLILFNECIKLRIPMISIVDSNISLWGIDYPVFGNDESIVSTNLYNNLYLNSINMAKSKESLNLKKICYSLNLLYKKNIFSVFTKFSNLFSYFNIYNIYLLYKKNIIYLIRRHKFKFIFFRKIAKKLRKYIRYKPRRRVKRLLIKKILYKSYKGKYRSYFYKNKLSLVFNLFFNKLKLIKYYFNFHKSIKSLLSNYIYILNLLYKFNCNFNNLYKKRFKFIILKTFILKYKCFIKYNL